MIQINVLLKAILLIIFLKNIQIESIKLTIEPICLSDIPSESILRCEDKQSRLFITSKQYSNDVTNYCNKKIISSVNIKKCNAYNTQQLANECNGKQECIVKLDKTNFTYGFMGSTCDFQAEILSITYECIPTDFKAQYMPKYDICGSSDRNSIIDHPIHGFIHSPSYPKNYPSKQYCQLTIRLDETIDRIEIFLIDMNLEGLSTTTYKPTDYLQINSNEQLFGEKNFSVIYNESVTAVITFRSDLWFNKPGFLLYFQIVRIIKTTTTTTTTSSTTTTTTTATTPITTNVPITAIFIMNSTRNETYNSSEFASMSSFDKIKDLSNTYSVLDIASRTIFILITIIGILSLIVIFLLFKRKNKMNLQTTNSSKIQFVNRTSDTTNVDYYLTSLDKSVGMLTCNSIGFVNSAPLNQQPQFYKINYINRGPDDSAIQLLINGSISTSSANQVNLKSSTEVYEDINNIETKKENLINDNLKKMNEYHYIPFNIIRQDGSNNDIIQTACANFNGQLDISSSLSSSNSSTFNSPSRITSTPTAPKTLPPTRLDLSNSFSIKINNEDIQNNEANSTSTKDYKSFLTDSETVLNQNNNNTTLTLINEKVNSKIEFDEQNYEYQIPSNLPTK